MRLVEAMVEANHRALSGDPRAGLRAADFASSLPIAALTCIDPRLHPLMPEVLGVAEEDFIWVTNAGNRIAHPGCDTLITLSLACAVHRAREILIIGHTDCPFCNWRPPEMVQRLQTLGIDLAQAAGRLDDFLNQFADVERNVQRTVQMARSSALIAPTIPIHGLLVDIRSGRLDWIVNGYQSKGAPAVASAAKTEPAPPAPVVPDGKLGGGYKIGGDLPPIGSV
jgi:carbonic anhydrase